MQGKDKIILDALENIVAFKVKVILWMHQMEQGKIAFSSLNAFVEEEEELHFPHIRQLSPQYLSSFLAELDNYVPSHDYSTTFN